MNKSIHYFTKSCVAFCATLILVGRCEAATYHDEHSPHFSPQVPLFDPSVHQQIIYEYTFVAAGLSFGASGAIVGDLAARTEEHIYFTYKPGHSGPEATCRGDTTRRGQDIVRCGVLPTLYWNCTDKPMVFTGNCTLDQNSLATPEQCGLPSGGWEYPPVAIDISQDSFWCVGGYLLGSSDNPNCNTTTQNITGGTLTTGLAHSWGNYDSQNETCGSTWFNQGVLFRLFVTIDESNYTSISFSNLTLPIAVTGQQPCIGGAVNLTNPTWFPAGRPTTDRFRFDVFNFTDKFGAMLPVQITATTNFVDWQDVGYIQASQFSNNKFIFTDIGVDGNTPKRYYRARVSSGGDCCSPQTIGFVNVQAAGNNAYTMAARPLSISDQHVSTLISSPVDGMIVYIWDSVNQGYVLNNYGKCPGDS